MSYDYPRLFAKIVATVSDDSLISQRMQDLISECEAQRPHPDWSRVRKIDFEADEEKIESWFSRSFSGAMFSAPPSGLWVGLVNLSDKRGHTVAEAYAGASPTFQSLSNDWARSIESVTDKNYLGSNVLREIYQVAYEAEDGLENDAEHPLVLAYGAMATRMALASSMLPTELSAMQGVAVGFDSGDYLHLGEFTDGQFISNVRIGG
jgi:hypothetical protein